MRTGNARIRILAVGDHPIGRSALRNEPEFQAPRVPRSHADNRRSSRILTTKAPDASTNAVSRKP
jgi:hypothetical protein